MNIGISEKLLTLARALLSYFPMEFVVSLLMNRLSVKEAQRYYVPGTRQSNEKQSLLIGEQYVDWCELAELRKESIPKCLPTTTSLASSRHIFHIIHRCVA